MEKIEAKHEEMARIYVNHFKKLNYKKSECIYQLAYLLEICNTEEKTDKIINELKQKPKMTMDSLMVLALKIK